MLISGKQQHLVLVEGAGGKVAICWGLFVEKMLTGMDVLADHWLELKVARCIFSYGDGPIYKLGDGFECECIENNCWGCKYRGLVENADGLPSRRDVIWTGLGLDIS